MFSDFLFLFLLAEKPNCGLYNVFADVFSFVNCMLFHDEQKLFAIFCNQGFFFFIFLFPTCKLYILRYTEDKFLFSLPGVEVLDRTQGLFS